MMKIALITPFPPYRGGISAHSKNLYDCLSVDNEITVYGDGNQTRSFCYVYDLIEGIQLLMNSGS